MLLGADQLGRQVLGELSGIDAEASGQIVTAVVSLKPGQAYFDNNIPGRARGRLYEQAKRVQRVDAVAPGATITAIANLRAGVARGMYQFSITSSPVVLAPPTVLGSVTGTVSRKAVVSGGLMMARSEIVSGVASGTATAPGAVIEGVMPDEDEDVLFMEEFA